MTLEPSVLDYVKSKLTPWRRARVSGGPACSAPQTAREEEAPASPRPWLTLGALVCALAAQMSLAPGPNRAWDTGAALYSLAAVLFAAAAARHEWTLPFRPEAVSGSMSWAFGKARLAGGLLLALLAFVLFAGGRFTGTNVLVWAAAVVLCAGAFWRRDRHPENVFQRLRVFVSQREWVFRISRWHLILLAAFLLALFFRAYRLAETPAEMTSDHAEQLSGALDVLDGKLSVFFPRSTSREPLQSYLAAIVSMVFGTGLSFATLKVTSVLCGLLTLAYIYLLGREIADRRAGLCAMLLAGIGYWPIVISRLGLNFGLYPLFAAATLYHLLRALGRDSRNDFVLAGLLLGLGLYGYAPFQAVPFAVVTAVGLYLLHRQSAGKRKAAVLGLAALILVSLVVFLPLFRYALESPARFVYPSLTRATSLERPLPGSVGLIFLGNLRNALTMFAWDDGEVWLHSVVHVPALDLVSAALLYIGVLLLLWRYLARRDWMDLFLLLSVPLLMMPSILSLAFPRENPSLCRTAGALAPVFVLAGVALSFLLAAMERLARRGAGRAVALTIGLALVGWSCSLNYDLVFQQYDSQYRNAAWNTSEMGRVIRNFAQTAGGAESAWVVAFPHWVDTRLVGVNAGYPRKDYAIWPEHLSDALLAPGPKLFLVKPEDTKSVSMLQELYPDGVLRTYASRTKAKDFLTFFVSGRDRL